MQIMASTLNCRKVDCVKKECKTNPEKENQQNWDWKQSKMSKQTE